MKPPAQAAAINQETAFLDYVERLRKFRTGRRAIHARISHLRPYNRRGHHLRIAATTFDRLIRDFEAVLFRLFNDDLVIICSGASVADIDRSVLHLRYLFSDDPLLKEDEEDAERFCKWFDLEHDYPELLGLARRMVQARAEQDALAAAPQRAAEAEAPPTAPMDATNLAVIEAAIAQADLSSMFRRQPICALTRDREPEPVFFEIYTSIEALRRTLMPKINLHANRWLFQDLTLHLDRRMISYLAHCDDGTLRRSFSLNLNVATLLSPGFLDFDEAHNNGSRSIVIELQLVDVVADLTQFTFARDFLRERGYKFCLDGITPHTLPLIDREKLGFDLVKLVWSVDMLDQLDGPRGGDLRAAAQAVGAERLILARCDSERALEVGRSLGITLYQGYELERMLSQRMTKTEAIHAMSEALARHRAARRT